MPQIWDKQEPVFREMLHDEKFEPKLIVTPTFDYVNMRVCEFGEEKAYFEGNARTLITLWGNKSAAYYFRDYSAREWQGLLEDFYKPRWERFISRLEISLLSGKKIVPADDYNEEVAFTFEKKKYPNKPSGDLRKAVENILKKVTSVEIEDGIVIKDTSTFEEKVMADINREKK